ncbi:hypothetical protein [Pseudomonas sp. KNUC1026]|uniref:hypothetical protein n=1 Tax=Pseudomonas sp. KNUC1026 TaxID=2893890 RepID=UPI001F337F19|nr:hypothetical protein [Pseudomonas sp. KNUC1026]UFH48281.1 hypothetical protein LN139_14015 [Pseudomonas sp. KNUC1026]
MKKSKEKTEVEKLLEWMGTNDYTWGSSAVAIYGREATNLLLRQEYIEKFNTGETVPLWNEWVKEEDNLPARLVNITFDAPLITFNLNEWSSPIVKLVHRTASGMQLSVAKQVTNDNEPDQHQHVVHRLRYISPMNGPVKEDAVNLASKTGDELVAKAYMPLYSNQAAQTARFTVTTNKKYEKEAGEKLNAYLRTLPKVKTEYVFGEVREDANHFFQPKEFVIRVTKKTSAEESADTDGSTVMLFIKAHEDDRAGYPESEPARSLLADPHNATLALSGGYLLRRVLETGFVTLIEGGAYALSPLSDDDAVAAFKFKSGKLKKFRLAEEGSDWNLSGDTPEFNLGEGTLKDDPLAGASGMTIKLVKRNGIAIDLTWAKREAVGTYTVNGQSVTVEHNWMMNWTYNLTLRNSQLMLEIDNERTAADMLLVPQQALAGQRQIIEVIEKKIKEICLDEVLAALEKAVGNLNVMHLNQLLFRSDDPVPLDKLELAKSPVMFGQVSPSRTAFYIETPPSTAVLTRARGTGERPARTVELQAVELDGEGKPGYRKSGAARYIQSDTGMGDVIKHVTIGEKMHLKIGRFGEVAIETVAWSVVSAEPDYTGELGSFSNPAEIETYYLPPARLVNTRFITVRVSAKVKFKSDSSEYISSELVRVYDTRLHVGPLIQRVDSNKLARLSVTSSQPYDTITAYMEAPGSVVGESIEPNGEDPEWPWTYTAPAKASIEDPDAPGHAPGYLLRRAIFHDREQTTTADAYFWVQFQPEEFAIICTHSEIDSNRNRIQLSAVWTNDGEVVTDEYGDLVWTAVHGEGELIVSPDGATATYTYSPTVKPMFVFISLKMIETRREAEDETFAPPLRTCRYGARIIPLPWVDIPDPELEP